MGKYVFEMRDVDHDNEEYSCKVEFSAETYDEVVAWFEQFLRCSGFIFNGSVEITNQQDAPFL